VAGVKISPSLVEFYDAEPNIVHQMKVSIQNLDKTSKHVKLLPPSSAVRFLIYTLGACSYSQILYMHLFSNNTLQGYFQQLLVYHSLC